MKTCNKCGCEKPATAEYFYRNKRCKDGLHGKCKECEAAYNKQHYQADREYFKSKKREYYLQNRTKRLEYQKSYYLRKVVSS